MHGSRLPTISLLLLTCASLPVEVRAGATVYRDFSSDLGWGIAVPTTWAVDGTASLGDDQLPPERDVVVTLTAPSGASMTVYVVQPFTSVQGKTEIKSGTPPEVVKHRIEFAARTNAMTPKQRLLHERRPDSPKILSQGPISLGGVSGYEVVTRPQPGFRRRNISLNHLNGRLEIDVFDAEGQDPEMAKALKTLRFSQAPSKTGK